MDTPFLIIGVLDFAKMKTETFKIPSFTQSFTPDLQQKSRVRFALGFDYYVGSFGKSSVRLALKEDHLNDRFQNNPDQDHHCDHATKAKPLLHLR